MPPRMETRTVEAVFRALNEARVRYLVAGGLAVVAHGYLRTTRDLDLFVQLEENNLRRAIPAMESLGYLPTLPVAFASFADEERRSAWVREKGARVFELFSEEHRTVGIDLFVEEPFPFDSARDRAEVQELAPGVEVPFVSLDDLVAMKRAAGRPQDLIDIDQLERIRDLTSE